MKHVLVADDHEIARRGVREILQEAFPDVIVAEASDADTALAMLRTNPWDLILLDVVMPGRNILDVLAQIRAIDDAVPVLMLTGVTEINYLVQTMKAGANGFVEKQRTVDDLVVAMKQVADGGVYMHPDTAIAIATQLRTNAPTHSHLQLSGRELEVFRLIALGRTVKEIGGDLGVSDKTVATYLARIREKTGLTRSVEIARYALQHGLVE